MTQHIFDKHTAKRPLFHAPIAGRKITATFSYLQRIGKHASTNVWLPKRQEKLIAEHTGWAAIRQFELLQEADNLAIDDLDVTNMAEAHRRLMRMRAGGHRMTIVTLGQYDFDTQKDELAILDLRLQEEIAQLINFLYLDELSEHESIIIKEALKKHVWSYETALPHIAKALGEKHLFKPEAETMEERVFFEILCKLPQDHIVHDTAIGLVLPDATKEKNWTYIAKGENRFSSFHGAIKTVLRDVTGDMACQKHMRGYGDHMKAGQSAYNKKALLALAA